MASRGSYWGLRNCRCALVSARSCESKEITWRCHPAWSSRETLLLDLSWPRSMFTRTRVEHCRSGSFVNMDQVGRTSDMGYKFVQIPGSGLGRPIHHNPARLYVSEHLGMSEKSAKQMRGHRHARLRQVDFSPLRSHSSVQLSS